MHETPSPLAARHALRGMRNRTAVPFRTPRSAIGTRETAGIALPVSLLALIAVSVLITSLILTGTNESLLSVAHQDATTGLYAAEGGVQAYLAEKGVRLAPVEHVGYTPPGGTSPVQISVERLARLDPAGGVPDTVWIYAIRATQAADGRTVAALARIRNVKLELVDGLEAAVSVAARLNVRGNSRLSDGSDGTCPLDAAAWAAARTAGSPGIDWWDQTALQRVGAEGSLDGVQQDALLDHLLGAGLSTLAGSAAIRFGSRFGSLPFGEPHGAGNRTGTATSEYPASADYNWGCPAGMAASCAADDAQRRPRVAIDASAGGDWGTVTLRGGHGHGILVVVGGNLRLQQGFRYRGIIIVEGALEVPGPVSAEPIEVEGAIIVLGGGPGATPSEIAGSSLIRFNRCVVQTAIDDFNADGVHAAALTSGTFGWVEVVR